jgi:hypothetical protein
VGLTVALRSHVDHARHPWHGRQRTHRQLASVRERDARRRVRDVAELQVELSGIEEIVMSHPDERRSTRQSATARLVDLVHQRVMVSFAAHATAHSALISDREAVRFGEAPTHERT